jgi:Cys-rich protein (TIGR01571 family)
MGSSVFLDRRSSIPVGHWRVSYYYYFNTLMLYNCNIRGIINHLNQYCLLLYNPKDDMCACCGLGCCHPTIWMAYCCPIILLGQVMHRLKLTWLANEGGNAAQTSITFRTMLFLGISTVVTRAIAFFMRRIFLDENGAAVSDNAGTFILILECLLWGVYIFILVLMCKTRRHIRDKFQIPEQQCHGCEDCCCVYWCHCCTVAQMARHTGDYKTHGARFCSETGLPPDAPCVV